MGINKNILKKQKICTQREVDYIRISITDKCNLRCIYCMPRKGVVWKSREEILSFEEITRLVKIMSLAGIKKVRITGGEPLVRRSVSTLISELWDIPEIEEVSLTTNGVLLPFMARELKDAGLSSLNISLDTLNREKFRKITRRDAFLQVIQGIERAKECGFSSIKINTLLMKGINDDEIIDFVKFGSEEKLVIRFIEFMKVTPLWNRNYYFPADRALKICKNAFHLQKVGHVGSGPAVYYRIGNDNLVGFIKTDECILLKLCLYEKEGIPLKDLLRSGKSDEVIFQVIGQRLRLKNQTNYRTWGNTCTYMYTVGG